MSRRKTIFTGFLPLLSILLCTGCPAAVTAPETAAGAAERPAATDDGPVADSIVCGESCTEYTCYFTGDRLGKEALANIKTLLFNESAWYTNFEEYPDAESADLARRQALDSLSSLAWLDSEPWPEVRELFLAWSAQQLERNYIVYRSRRDPYFLYECSETDSTIVRCADLLTRQEEGRVERIRQFLKANELEKAARDSMVFDKTYLDYALRHIDEVLARPDSLRQAVDRVFQTLSNHINRKIHARLSKEGTVDFTRYTEDFLALFDSVKVETWEP